MKTRKLIFGLTALVLAGSLMLTSCKKKSKNENQEEPDKETSSSTDNSYAETTVNDIQGIGAQGSENSSLSTYKNPYSESPIMWATCAVVTPSPSLKTFTVDFGTGCLGQDSKYRSGMLIYSWAASTGSATAFRHPGFSYSVSAVNYVVDGYSVQINNKTVTNTTAANFNPTVTPLTWSIAADIKITKPSSAGGGVITWVCNRTLKLLNTSDPNVYKGIALPVDWKLAKLQVDGTASGSNAAGESYTAVAANLVRDFTCTPNSAQLHRHPFVSGTIKYKPGNKLERTIDFGTGTCDFAYTVEIGGTTYGPFGQ